MPGTVVSLLKQPEPRFEGLPSNQAGANQTTTNNNMKALSILLSLSCLLSGSSIPDFPFIYVRGHASENIATNLATIRFDIAKHSRISDQGETRLSEASKSIRKLLRDAGIKDKDINATEISKREEYGEFPESKRDVKIANPMELPPLDGPDNPDPTKKKEAYYSFTQQFVIQIHDLKIYPDLARQLIRSGDVSRYDVNFSATNRKDVVDRLRRSAFADAKRAAIEIADASGEKLDRIHSASEMPFSELGQLVGEEDQSNGVYAGTFSEERIYEAPPTVSEAFGIYVLFRIAKDQNPESNTGRSD